MIQLLNGALRIANAGGVITRDFHLWLQAIARAISSTYVADRAPGRSLAIGADQYGIHAEELVLNGTEELTIEGNGILVIV